MRTKYADRLWALGGTLVTVAMLAFGWLLLVGPKYTQTATLRGDVEASEIRLTKLRSELTALKQQNNDLARYREKLKADQAALPADTAMPDFLTNLQEAGARAGVRVTGLTVNAPVAVTGVEGQLFRLPLTVNAAGSPESLQDFLKELQKVQPRAVLIRSVDTAAGEGGNDLTLALNLDAFMAPTAATPGTPTPPATN